jgi:hypothetical protein
LFGLQSSRTLRFRFKLLRNDFGDSGASLLVQRDRL